MVTCSGQRPLQPWLSFWLGGAGLDTTWACTIPQPPGEQAALGSVTHTPGLT